MRLSSMSTRKFVLWTCTKCSQPDILVLFESTMGLFGKWDLIHALHFIISPPLPPFPRLNVQTQSCSDDPEAVVRVCNLAVQWRQRYKQDVVVDIVCLRP